MNGFFQVREVRVRLATNIDDIGAGCCVLATTRHDLFNAECWCLDDLGEDADVMLRKIWRAAAVSEVLRQVDDFIGTAFERNTEFSAELFQVHARTSGHNHPVGRN